MKPFRLILILWATTSNAIADDPEALKKRLKDLNGQNADHWIYNDISAGFAEAKRTGRPLFLTFRCVPCVDCLGFDGEVADGNEAIKQLAGEEFVGVRQIEMKGVDLTQFQFDHDLNWAGMFLNADGTISVSGNRLTSIPFSIFSRRMVFPHARNDRLSYSFCRFRTPAETFL